MLQVHAIPSKYSIGSFSRSRFRTGFDLSDAGMDLLANTFFDDDVKAVTRNSPNAKDPIASFENFTTSSFVSNESQ